MLSISKTIAIVLLLASIVGLIIFLPKVQETAPPPKEVPCEDLAWMKDAPQARCVEYWNNIKVEEA